MTSAVPRLKGLAAIAAASFATAAFAGLPTGTASFITPLGIVGPNDSIDVWVHFTLGADSAPLRFSTDPLTGLLTGFDAADLPTRGSYWDAANNKLVEADFARITAAFLTSGFGCPSNFALCVSNPAYTFKFSPVRQPGMPASSFDLAPGQSFDYLFGQLTPNAGGAAPGNYTFYRTSLSLYFQGVDAEGHVISFVDSFPGGGSTLLAATCPSFDNACAFRRTVVAVPEPATYGLMALGLGVVGLLARRKGLQAG